MRLVIGLMGRIGSGKTAVSEHLQENYGAREHRFSQILMDILDRLNLPHERANLQKLGKSLRAELGADVIVNAFKHDLEKDTKELLIVDGIRYENEVNMLKEKNCVLIFVTASPEVRYERAVKRGEKGEAKITFEQFLESEKAETEKHIEAIKESADYTIDNSGTLDELQGKVDKIIKGLKK
ncbi:AAA family ATPase [archaeon]|nr:AAA family ATPase [archaeon]